MAIHIRDHHLESLVDAEREKRGDATVAKTANDLIREYLAGQNSHTNQSESPSPRENPSDFRSARSEAVKT